MVLMVANAQSRLGIPNNADPVSSFNYLNSTIKFSTSSKDFLVLGKFSFLSFFFLDINE